MSKTTRKCIVCGQDFSPRTSRSKVCDNPECRRIHNNQLVYASIKRKRGQALCAVCGKILPAKRRTYCSDECARIAHRKLQREKKGVKGRTGNYYVERACIDCGTVVTMSSNMVRCLPCQMVRQREKNKAAQAKYKASMETARTFGSIAICERCGEPYTVRGALQKYCDACRPAAMKEADKVRYRKKKEALSKEGK